ncbi:MAG: hypothetical protein J6I76_17775 [Oribacterium sp.]|nr:hypothetical protein [Oribacterium sp.]
MRIHYFQRYHTKENVATANTMLLLSRLYQYSSDKFFRFLKSEYFSDQFEPELSFTLQEKSVDSVPDATITQESFKIVVETKMSDWFYSDQLMRHLHSFSDEKYKVMLTVAPEQMDEKKLSEVGKQIAEYNKNQTRPVVHINTTFERIAQSVQDVIDDRDYEMQDVIDDYLNYCYSDGLIPVADSWKYMRSQLAGTTFDFNIMEDVYYDNADRGFRAHDYLGLYKEKSVRAIGKICARILAVEVDGELQLEAEVGDITDERKEKIIRCIEDGDSHGYDLHTIKHRYFFVEKFYSMDYKKTSPRAPMGSRIFNLAEVLGTDELPDTEKIAGMLSEKTWE